MSDPKPYIVTGENNSWRVGEEDARFILDRPEVYAPRFSVRFEPRSELESAS